jgi:tetratricopeptide (TPR) repeat protein
MEDMQNALTYYKKAFELKPQDSEIAYYIASIYADKEDYTSAEAYAQKSLLLKKDNKESKDLLDSIYAAIRQKTLENAIALFEHEDYVNALPLLDKVIAEDSKNSYALYYRAMVYDAQKKYKEAIADYKAAIKINPNDLKIINYMLAVDYDALEKYKDAYDYYVKYTSSEVPDDEYKTYATDRAKELKEYVEQSTKPVADKK